MRNLKQYTILIVDDETIYLQSLIDAIRQINKNYKVLQSNSAELAFGIIQKRVPDIIITDWDMPGMDGIQLIKKIKLEPEFNNIPIIMSTGVMTTTEDLKIALDAGANDYIRKPVDVVELEARLNSLIKYSESQKKISESEVLFRSIFENSNIGVSLMSKKGEFLRVNDEMTHIFGYTKDEFNQISINEIFSGGENKKGDKLIEEILIKEESLREMNIQSIHKSGKKIYCMISSAKIDNPLEKDYFFVVHVKDITEQKTSEHNLSVSEQKFNSIVSNANEAIFIIQDGVLKFVNQYTTQITGFTEDILLGKSLFDFFHPDDRKQLKINYRKRRDNQETSGRDTFKIINASGETIWVEVSSIIHTWENKPAILAFLTDITQRIKYEMEFRKQTKEIERANIEITNQKSEIEKSHHEILSSIKYAKDIQHALLPMQEFITSWLPNHFILFKPSNIVSGDFYFFKQIGNQVVIAVADCTGHGIPGAFMSMLGITMLNEIVRRISFLSAHIILNELRNEIKKSLKQTGQFGEHQDGMDIALCIINLESNELQFAGANQPCWIFRPTKGINGNNQSNSNQEEEYEFLKLQPDHQPVGIYRIEKPFTEHLFKLEPGDLLYLFTDGYKSQFGGDKNQKYKSGRLKKTLNKICHFPLDEQKQILESEFDQWKGDYEQTDDMLILGIKL